MKYLADCLTLLRFVFAPIVAICILQDRWLLALLFFAIAALSDALDGICARRWPYTPADEARLPWRKIDSHVLDNLPDGAMVALATLALAVRFSYWWWLLVLIYGVSIAFMLVVKLLVRSGKPRAAEIVDVVYGFWFVINVGMVLCELAFRAGYLHLMIFPGVVIAFGVLVIKRDRAFSRPETRADALKHRSRQ